MTAPQRVRSQLKLLTRIRRTFVIMVCMYDFNYVIVVLGLEVFNSVLCSEFFVSRAKTRSAIAKLSYFYPMKKICRIRNFSREHNRKFAKWTNYHDDKILFHVIFGYVYGKFCKN